jgi:hypothetical protein
MTQRGTFPLFDLWPTPSLLCLGLALTLMTAGRVSAATLPSATLGASLLGQGEYGTITGRLVWGGDEAPAPKVLEPLGKASKDPNVCAKNAAILDRAVIVDPKTNGVAYGLAYLVRPKGSNPEAVKELLAKHPQAVLDQKNCEFEPFVLPMHQDQTLLIKTSDPVISHNVRMSAFTNPGANQTLVPGGKLQLKLVPERRPISMACDIHPWMKSWVLVCDHPFFATTAADGSFEIKGVPAGPQKLILWHANAGYVTPGAGAGTPVEVKAGKVMDIGEIKLDPIKAVKP